MKRTYRVFLPIVAFLFGSFLLSASAVWADNEALDPNLLRRIDELIRQLDQAKVKQDELVANQQDILEEVKRLKIWVNKRR